MTLPTITGRLDTNLGYIIPIDTDSTWSATSSTTWAGFNTWSSQPANPLIWLSDTINLGSKIHFNLLISATYQGDIAYDIYVSNTGQFDGEETVISIAEGDANIESFYGQYVIVAAKVYKGASLNVLNNLSITTQNKSFDITQVDIDTSELIGDSTSRILSLGRDVSKVLTMTLNTRETQTQPYVLSNYIASDYFDLTSDGYFVVDYIDRNYVDDTTYNSMLFAFQVSKDRTYPSICLRNQIGEYVDGYVDAVIKVLPEQYMSNGQLLTR